MSRLSKEMEERIRRYHTYLLDNQLTADVSSLLGEIDALRTERDEAIVGAYRAAAEITEKHAMQKQGYEFEWDRRELHAGGVTARQIGKEILALTPQSALDAVERDRREIAEAGLGMMDAWYVAHLMGDDRVASPTADDVIAKVNR